MSSYRIAFLGECMIELHEADGVMSKGFGGDTLNSAIYLSRLERLVKGEQQGDQQNTSVSFLSAMGQESQSDDVLTACEHEGVDVFSVVRIEGKLPGIYLIENDDTGERRFHYWRSESAARYWTHSFDDNGLLDQLLQFDAVYLSGISLAIQFPEQRERLIIALRRYREAGGIVMFDTNYRARLWANQNAAKVAFEAVLSLSNLALLTFDDEADLFGDATPEETLKRVTALGCPEIIIKCGSKACLVSVDDEVTSVSALRVETVVDTTSAGDAFNAGYMFGYVNKLLPTQSAQLGHLLASHVIQAKGAIIPLDKMPTYQQINSRIKHH